MAGFEKINFTLRDDPAQGAQSRLRALTRDARGGGLAGLSPESAETAGQRQLLPSAETAGRLYLQTYLEDARSPGLESVTSPSRPELVPDMRQVDSKPVDGLISQAIVFEQTWKGFPVFGGRVVVDVDQSDRSLVTINGQVAPPPDVSALASLSAMEAAQRAQAWAASGEIPAEPTATLTWLYDEEGQKWHLCWHLAAMPLVPPHEDHAADDGHDHRFCLGPSPRSRTALIEVFVDAHDGKVVFFFSSTPCLNVPIPMTGYDERGIQQDFFGLQTPSGFVLSDPLRNIVTYDYGYQDIDINPLPALPTQPISHGQRDLGPTFPAAVSAHVNATLVFDFFNDVLKRDGVDDRGMQLISVVKVWSSQGGTAPHDWINAVWWQNKMWYGEANNRSLAAHLDVIAHELTHGVTETTSGLVYRDLPGALNESYSDIFGVIIANWYPNKPEPLANWQWTIGAGLANGGGPLRDFSNPAAAGQPDHFSQYRRLPFSRDYGGVHIYSGIHNKAIYHLLTDTDASGTPTFPVGDVALLLYLTLTRLTQTSDFRDSRNTLESVTKAYYGNPAVRTVRLNAIATAFGKVGL